MIRSGVEDHESFNPKLAQRMRTMQVSCSTLMGGKVSAYFL